MNQRILVIIPYFGEWPSYFNLYLKSCTINNWLNIIFFTDCKLPNIYPENVSFVPFSLKDFNNLVSLKLKCEIDVKHPYKICDFRPCFGVIFEDYLVNYDYWGYGDIDLIYGDLKPFIIDKIIEGFDVVSNRKEILSGSLSIFKNINLLKELYKTSPKFISLLKSDAHQGLDETANDHRTWHGGEKLDLPKHCFTYLIANEHQKGSIRVSFSTICKEEVNSNEVIYYRSGKLSFNDISLGYYHYVCNKNRYEYVLPRWNKIPQNFFITKTGFHKNNGFYLIRSNYRYVIGQFKKILFYIWERLIR